MIIVGACLATLLIAFLMRKKMSSDRTILIHTDKLPSEMRDSAIQAANKAIDACRTIGDMAGYIKKAMDEKHGPAWCCVVGRSFGSVVRHEADRFLHFSVGHQSVALWKCGDGQPSDNDKKL
jgi:dynein light chain LC8-type